MMQSTSPRAPHLIALFGLSAATLAFEILLLRLFELSHWHAFAGLAIGLALLGLGAAGTTLTLAGDRIQRSDERWFVAALIATAVGLQGVILVHAHIALRPIVATWDAIELVRLLLVDLSAFVPFYAGGLAIGRAFARWPQHTRSLYALNLLGSASGCIAASVLLVALHVETALALVALVVAMLGTLAAARTRLVPEALAGALAIIGGIVLVVDAPPPAVSDFKALARARELPDATVLLATPGLRGPLTVVRSDALRFAPGLSLAWPEPVPAADVAIIGSDREIPLARAFERRVAHAAASLAGLPFVLRPEGNVLVLGASAWQSAALAGPAHHVVWVEPDPRVTKLAQARGATAPHQMLIADHPYRQLLVTRERFALIVADHAYAGGDAAGEDYLLTDDGIALALSRLAPDGLLAIPLRVTQPPRHFPRLLATGADGLKRYGIAHRAAHVVALRGLQAQLLLIAAAPFGAADLARMREFARRWQFDFDWPDAGAGLPTAHHQLDTPVFYTTARAILAGASELPSDVTWFATGPADFDQPYVWRSLVWDRAYGMLEALGLQAMTLLDWSLVFGAVTLAITTLLGFALILAPLGRLPLIARPFTRTGIATYFVLLGVGYLFVEIAVLQRATLFLDEPVLAASIVIATFLAGSGIGSAMAPESVTRAGGLRLFGVVGAGLALVYGLLWLATPLLLAPELPLRIAIVIAALLPLAWTMGRPFPWALLQIADQPRWIPWVWGINGFASVAAASLAPLISVHRGQSVTLAMGLLCYGLALGVALRWIGR
jgi:hypothetical protein